MACFAHVRRRMDARSGASSASNDTDTHRHTHRHTQTDRQTHTHARINAACERGEGVMQLRRACATHQRCSRADELHGGVIVVRAYAEETTNNKGDVRSKCPAVHVRLVNHNKTQRFKHPAVFATKGRDVEKERERHTHTHTYTHANTHTAHGEAATQT